MKALYWREWKKQLRSVSGLLFLTLSMLMSGICFLSYQLVLGGPELDDTVPVLLYGMTALLPLLLWRMFGSKERDGDVLLRSLPVTDGQRFVGKLLAALTVLALANASMLLYPPVLAMLSRVSMGEAYAQLLMLFLCEVAVFSFAFFLFTLFRRRWVALAVFYGSSVLCVLLGVAAVLLPGEKATELLRGLSVFYIIEDIRYGLLDWSAVLYLAAWSALAITGAWLLNCHRERTGRARGVTSAGRALCGGMAALLVATGVLTSLLPTRISQLDVTASGKYTVSDETLAAVSALSEDVTVSYLSDGTSDSAYERYWTRLCAAGDRITYRKRELDRSADWLSELGIETVAVAGGIVVESQKRSLYIPYTDLFTYSNEILSVADLSYSEYYNLGMQYYANYLSAGTQEAYYYYLAWDIGAERAIRGEYMLVSSLAYVTAETVPTLYYLSGHGEPALSETALWDGCLLNFSLPVLDQFVTPVKEWSAQGPMPGDAAALIVNMPTSDLTEAELNFLLSYAEQGGKIFLLSHSDFLSLPNFNRLTAQYGMTAQAGPVMVPETVKDQDGNESTQESATVSGTVNYDHEALSMYANATSRFPTLTGADSILLDQETADGALLLTALLSSPAESYRQENPEVKGSHVMAAAAEHPNGMKLVWITGAEAINDSEAFTQNQSLFVTYLLSWCRKEYQNTVAEGAAVPFMEANRSVAATPMLVCGVLFCFLLPAGVLVTGLCVRYARRRRLPESERRGEEN